MVNMAGLEGNISTPLGPVSKKTAVIGGTILAVVVGVGYYRYRKSQAAAATAAAGSSVGTDPATGYLYGSAEDAAALTNQGNYQFPSGGGGGGSGSGVNNPGTGFVSNAQWSQAAIQYMQAQGLVLDSSLLSAALGAYLTGSPVTSDQKSLIEQAIAIEGYPPVSGSNGYPPSVNTGNNNGGGGGTTDTRKGPPYPFDGSPADPRFSVLPGWVVDNTITSLQAHGVHVSWSQVESLNGGTSRTPPAIWSNIRNNGSGKSSGNYFAAGYTYRLPPQTTWYK